jgi:hypothetical protein
MAASPDWVTREGGKRTTQGVTKEPDVHGDSQSAEPTCGGARHFYFSRRIFGLLTRAVALTPGPKRRPSRGGGQISGVSRPLRRRPTAAARLPRSRSGERNAANREVSRV